jgi:hypothetical protein
VRSGDTRVRLTSFSLAGISLARLMEGVRSSDAAPENWRPADARKFLPTIGTLRLGGLAVDGLAAATAGDAVDHVEIGSIELRSDKPVGGIPSEAQIAFRDITVPVVADAKSDGGKQLAAMGYAKVQASFGAAVSWDAAAQQLAIRDWSVRGTDMGSITVRGLIGNVSPDLFSPDQALAEIAAVGTTVRALDVTVQNDGLAERLLAFKAKEAGRTVDDLRSELGLGAAILIPAQLGGSAAAKALGQAVGKFVARPGTLKVELRAKRPDGLGIIDYLADPNPATLLDNFDVTATAQ